MGARAIFKVFELLLFSVLQAAWLARGGLWAPRRLPLAETPIPARLHRFCATARPWFHGLGQQAAWM